jgi:hypothetical protein
MLGKHWSSKSILLDSVLRRTIQRSKHNVSNGPVGFGLYCEHCLHLRRMPDPCRMGPIGMSALGWEPPLDAICTNGSNAQKVYFAKSD